MDNAFIDAREACALLGISQATLYAYVSRGLVESRPGIDHRSRLYLRRDVERLLQRKRAGRGAARGAAQSLDRGLPVLETSISLIRPDGPYYRGHAAIAAARDGATLEDAARLLWDCGDDDPFAQPFAERWPQRVAHIALDADLPPLERSMAALPLLALDVPRSFHAAAPVRHAIAAGLLRHNAALLVARQPSAGPVHRLLADGWKPGARGFAELVRLTLVTTADHELNVSAFAARVVASTGAHLHATACSGLAALSGPRHGGATARAFALIEDAIAADPRAWIVARRERGDDLPGFGHALYPQGDPRAAAILSQLAASRPHAATMKRLHSLLNAAEDVAGLRPNVDFALAAIAHAHGLPPATALVLFAAGRLTGWLAHALEQQARGSLIRPRARYVGAPADNAASQ
ncbi:MAG: citrate synthase family protein [Thermomonas sp.]|uniref:citrate synthase family protein n=1 Tax=Thermomonas sp. TaxID=1971895 RepID=UPI0039E6AEAA